MLFLIAKSLPALPHSTVQLILMLVIPLIISCNAHHTGQELPPPSVRVGHQEANLFSIVGKVTEDFYKAIIARFQNSVREQRGNIYTL